VWECRQEVAIPIVGMGGIMDARDALEFILAGANAVQIGTANFVDPFIWGKVLNGLADYMRRHSVARLQDLVGAMDESVAAPAPV
jgi:dihydroorotate dehydrogenase (NAD+) catalytic subunit